MKTWHGRLARADMLTAPARRPCHREMTEPSTNTLELELAPQKADAIHRALLSGLLGNVATRTDAVEYTAARGARCNIHPGSGLFRRRPGWIMAAELVETSKLYARTVAPI